MKKLLIAALMAAVFVPSTLAEDERGVTPMTSWRVKTLPVRAPFANDSIDPHGKTYKTTDLLGSRMSARLKGGETTEADTAGFVRLAAASNPDQNLMHVMQTQLRASRFTNGNLRVTSQAPFAVLVDGENKLTKKSVEDSLSSKSKRDVSLRLEPERDVTVTIRTLSVATDSVAPDVKIEFVADEGFDSVLMYTGADLKRRLNLGDTHFSNRVSGVELSPDGRYLLMRTYNSYDKDHSRTIATITDLNTGKIVNGNVRWNARWMPDENILYYTQKGKDGRDLYLIDPLNGIETLAATGLPDGNIRWAPDGKWFLYTDYDDGVKESGPLRRYATPDDRMPGDRGRSYIMRYDLETGLSQRLTFGNHSTYINDIAPDGSRVLISNMSQNPRVRPFYNTTFYQLDLATMKADTLVAPGPQFVNGASYSPDGRKVLFTGSPEAFGGIGRNCGEHPIANDYDVQMFIMDLDTRKVESVTRDFDPSVDKILCWSEADGRIYFIAEEGFFKPVYAYDPAKRTFDKLPLEVPYVNAADLAQHSAKRLAYTGQGYEWAGRAYLLDVKSGRNTLLADPYGEHLSEIQLGKMEPWNFTAKDGSVIEGYVCYPPDYNPDHKYPLIVYYYGGTSPSQTRLLQPYTPQLLASRDYIVYILNPSGTTGYGQEFSARHVNAWGKYTASDIIEGVEKFIADHPSVDKDCIGCMGASYGGFMTQYLLTQTPMFAAAVSHAGISNVTSYWGEGYWGYSYNAVAAADSYPWNNPDLFTKQGSLFNADKINTPLLLLHGTADTNVPIGESIQLFNALRILGKDVEFVSVDGENHIIDDIEKRQLWQNTIMAWFAKQLQNDSSWWDDLYPERNL